MFKRTIFAAMALGFISVNTAKAGTMICPTTDGKTMVLYKGASNSSLFDPERFRKAITSTAITSESPDGKHTTISFTLKKGEIEKPTILESSGNAQFDFDCLQAVLGMNQAIIASTETITETFSKDDFKRKDLSKSLNAKRANDSYLAFKILPIGVADRFIGLLNDSDTMAEDNIGLIPNSSKTGVSREAVETLRQIYCDKWGPISRDGAMPSREDLIKMKKSIKQELAKNDASP